nr:DUF4406 domain-containing protein [Microvirga lupini]
MYLTPISHRIKLAEDRLSSVYLAGPMTGYDDHNFPAFNACAAKLRGRFAHVVNPAEHGIVEGAEWGDYLRYDIGRLADCASIALLPGWSKSRGAQLEVHIAQKLGMPILLMDGAEEVPAVAGEQTDAVRDVLAERCRQVEKEGRTLEHDDEHDAGELAAAAAAYALNAAGQLNPHSQGDGGHAQPMCWPWEPEFWKPGIPRRDLVKAAALILAEIERWDRIIARGTTELYTEADEARMDVVGQNGNGGEHYQPAISLDQVLESVAPAKVTAAMAGSLPEGLSWEQAPEWATVVVRSTEWFIWAESFTDGAKAKMAKGPHPWVHDHISLDDGFGHGWKLIATRPAATPGRDATQA